MSCHEEFHYDGLAGDKAKLYELLTRQVKDVLAEGKTVGLGSVAIIMLHELTLEHLSNLYRD